jgi:hypothetical protein
MRVGLLALLVLAAPTAGDIGSCGQPVEELDPAKFFAEKDRIECARCGECSLVTRRCEQACAGAGESDFPVGCYPLAQDGEVCLRAIEAVDCEEVESYVVDEGAVTPSECDFCPAAARPEGG